MIFNILRLSIISSLFIMMFSASAADDAWMRSYTLEASGQYVAAAETIEHILKTIPANEFAELRSGWLYYLAGNYSRSIKHYQTAMKINKHSFDAILGISLPLMAQARWREAATNINEVIKLSRYNYIAHTRLMACEENLKQWSELKQHANELTSYYPADATILVYLARAHSHTDNPERAKEIYREVLIRYPGHLEATQYLSR